MAHLGFLHEYNTGGLLVSQHWDDELNQIIFALGSPISDFAIPMFILLESDSSFFLLKESDGEKIKLEASGVGEEIDVSLITFAIIFSGNFADSELPILKLNRLNTGNFVEIGSGADTSLITEQGQITINVDGLIPFILSSAIKCENLNADLLNSKNAVDFELNLYTAQGYFVYYEALQVNVGRNTWICPANSIATITKLRVRAETGGNVDAVTTFTFLKNDVSIGTITIPGNNTTLQTNDIIDVDVEEGDVINIIPTVVSGTTLHGKVTVGFNFKQRFINGS